MNDWRKRGDYRLTNVDRGIGSLRETANAQKTPHLAFYRRSGVKMSYLYYFYTLVFFKDQRYRMRQLNI